MISVLLSKHIKNMEIVKGRRQKIHEGVDRTA
jgi:hypothetical protein